MLRLHTLSLVSLLIVFVGCANAEDRDRDLGRARQPVSDEDKKACSFAFTGVGSTITASATKGLAGSATPILFADVNGDGKADIVAVTDATHLTTHIGKGDGTFTAGPTATLTIPTAALAIGLQGLVAGDFDGDGKQDVMLLSTTADPKYPGGSWFGTFVVAYGSTDGALTLVATSASHEVGSGGGTVFHVAGDFDGDGRDDFVFGNYGGERMKFGGAARTFSATTGVWPGGSGSSRRSEFALKPLTGKASLVIVTAGNTGKISWAADRKATVESNPTPGGSGALVGGDFDGDGRLELATGSSTALAITTLGTGGATSTFPFSLRPRSVVDLDANGKQELLYEKDGVLFAACGYGIGAKDLVATPLAISVGTSTSLLREADVNGDKKPDLITYEAGGAVRVYLSGLVQPYRRRSFPSPPRSRRRTPDQSPTPRRTRVWQTAPPRTPA